MEPIKRKSAVIARSYFCRILAMPHVRNTAANPNAAVPVKLTAKSVGRKTREPKLFCGPINVQRVQQWRKEHPGYWRRKSEKTISALQETLNGNMLKKYGYSRSAFRCVTRYLKRTTYCFIRVNSQLYGICVTR